MTRATHQHRFAFGSAGGFVCAAALTVIVLAGCAEQPLAPAVIPQNAAAPPPVAVAPQVLEAASEYRAYMKRAAAITPSFANGPQIEASLSSVETYEPKQLSRGVVAYGALVALQDPGFVATVRTFAVDPDGRRSLAEKIIADPNYVSALPNAPSAAGLVIAALNADSARVRGAGELVKQFAYDVQHQAWSKKDVLDPAGRLARAKLASAAPMTPMPEDVAELKGAVGGGDSKIAGRAILVSGQASAPPFTPLVSRSLAVAALAALGVETEDSPAVAGLLEETGGGFCLNMAKLNLYQCLAVAKPYYEDVFCLGQHILIDTSQCVTKETGSVKPVQVASTLQRRSPPSRPPPALAAGASGGLTDLRLFSGIQRRALTVARVAGIV